MQKTPPSRVLGKLDGGWGDGQSFDEFFGELAAKRQSVQDARRARRNAGRDPEPESDRSNDHAPR